MGYRSILILMSILVFFLPMGIVQGSISHPHWSPDAPLEGEDVDLFVLVTREDVTNISAVRASFNGINSQMIANPDIDDGNVSILYQGSLKFGSSGIINVTIQVLIYGEWIDEGSFQITVGENKDSNEDTIFGLPKLYCSISVMILTIIVIFFTWSYFKGRSMKNSRERDTGNIKVECSECGKPIANKDRSCPWCGIDLEEEEYVCGKCLIAVSREDEKCPFCDASLLQSQQKDRNIDDISKNKNINYSSHQKRNIELKSKRECKGCGTILMVDEKICPICNDRNA